MLSHKKKQLRKEEEKCKRQTNTRTLSILIHSPHFPWPLSSLQHLIWIPSRGELGPGQPVHRAGQSNAEIDQLKSLIPITILYFDHPTTNTQIHYSTVCRAGQSSAEINQLATMGDSGSKIFG